jgi:hypothetical protein
MLTPKLKQKFELTSIGYAFLVLNILATYTEHPIMGIVFGVIAFYFFIKSLRIKND